MLLTEPDSGWAYAVLVASFCGHCVAGFCMYAVGLFHVALLEKFQASVTLTSWISSIFLCLLSLSGPIASTLIVRWSCRVTTIIGSLLFTTGLVITAFSSNLYVVFVSLGLVSGLGVGLIFNAGYIILAFNFERKRNIATGISVSGCGLGPFILAPIYQKIYQFYGYFGFFLLIAGLGLQTCIAGTVFRPSRIEVASKLKEQTKEKTKRPCCDLTILKNIPLLFVGLGGLFFNIGIFIIYLHFPKYAIVNGSTEVEVSWCLSLAGIVSCIGRILLGLATNSDSVDENVAFFGSYVMLGIATTALPLGISLPGLRIVYMVVLGFYNGACYVVVNSIVLKLTGPKYVAHGLGYVMAFIGIGSLIGPPLGGIIVDQSGSYDISFIVAGLSLIIGGCFEIANVLFKTNTYKIPTTEDVEIPINNGFNEQYKHTPVERNENQDENIQYLMSDN